MLFLGIYRDLRCQFFFLCYLLVAANMYTMLCHYVGDEFLTLEKVYVGIGERPKAWMVGHDIMMRPSQTDRKHINKCSPNI